MYGDKIVSIDIDIVDDEVALRDLYQAIIEDAGFNVNCHASAEDYIAYTESEDFIAHSIALITDVRMPGKSGYELIDEVKKTNPNQRFVVITGTPQDGFSKDAKACFYLQKPVSMDRLLKVIALLSKCEKTGNHKQAHECKLLSDLDSFEINDWTCPNKK